MTDLNQRMAKGAAWMVLLRLADRGLGVISTLFLARLLVPADFGLVAMAMAVFAVLEIMGTFSFDMALIQNPNAERPQYDTAWTFTVLYGLVSGAILAGLASPAAALYADARIENILYALALCAAVQGFENIGVVAFQKDLELHKEFRFRMLKRMSAFVVTLMLAFWLRSYWALVLGTFFSRAVGVWLSFLLHPYRPRISLVATGDLMRFSKWMVYNNLLVFVVNRGTDFVIGKMAGPAALGTYSVAYEVSNLPTTELVYPIMRAVFPGYARIANDPATLRQSYLDVLAVIAIASVPAGLGIYALAEPIVLTLLGEKWREAVPLIQILAIYGVSRACGSNIGSVFLAQGKSYVLSAMGTVTVVVLVPLIFWLVPRYGGIGAAWSMLICSLITAPIMFYVLLRAIDLRFVSLASVLWRPFISAGVMAAVATALYQIFGAWPPFVQLAILAPVATATYIAVLLLLWRLVGRPRGAETMYLDWFRARAGGLVPAARV